MEEFNFAEKAFDHIRKLTEEIGPRPAGSLAEAQAEDYILEQLQSWGYAVEKKPAAFAPLARFNTYGLLSGLILIFAAWFIAKAPWVTLWLPLFFALLPALESRDLHRRPCTAQTANVSAFSEPAAEKPTLIFCAHVDSARVMGIRSQFLLKLYRQILSIIQRTAFLVAILSLFQGLGFRIPAFLYLFVGGAASIVGVGVILLDLYNQFAQKEVYTAGALDNASGVGVCLSLAEYFSRNPAKRLRLGFLFTGAEETGLHGAEAYAAELARQTGRYGVVNLDMVGSAGQLVYVASAGTLFPTLADENLIEVLCDAVPQIKPIVYTVRQGDFLPFLWHKIPAVSLETRPTEKVDLVYHTEKDTLDNIRLSALENTAKAMVKLIELLPYSKWAVDIQKKGSARR